MKETKSKHRYSTITLIIILGLIVMFPAIADGFEAIKFVDPDEQAYGISNINNKPIFINNDLLLEVSRGNVANMRIIQKFGTNENVGNNWEAVTTTGTYETPLTATQLQISSDDADDTNGGTGGQIVTIQGINSTWDEVVFNITLNGLTPVQLPQTMFRIYRMYIVQSGTYATSTQGSHEGRILVEETISGTDWADLAFIDGFPSGQTEIGVYTIPKGYTGYILSKHINVDATRPLEVALYKRENADDLTAPYIGTMRIIEHHHNIANGITVNPNAPLTILPELTDIGFMAKVAQGSATVSVDFEILLIENEVTK